MRTVITAIAAATATLMAASTLGVATAEAPTTALPRLVSVEGVATQPIEQKASAAAAATLYHQEMEAAVTDGQTKAQLLAGKVGGTLGAAQSVVEGGGYITCPENVEYEGEQPDSGAGGLPVSAAGVSAAPAAPQAARPTPVLHKPVKRHKLHNGPVAKKANVTSCTLSTQVSLVYALG
jgi:hypothetical protein